jgi:WD40 repeat protein
MRTCSRRLFLILWSCLLSGLLACTAPAAGDGDNATDRVEPTRADIYGDSLPTGAVARLGTLRLRHIVRDGSGAACVVFSPDGKILISGGDVGLRIWDVATGKALTEVQDNAPVTSAHFSQDGRMLITSDNSGTIRRWQVDKSNVRSRDAPRRQPKERRRPPDFRGRESFFSADGKVAGVVTHDQQVLLWEVETSKQILAKKEPGGVYFFSAALSPEGKTLVVTADGNRAHLIDVASGQEIRLLEGPNQAPHLQPGFARMREEAVHRFAFSPDGRLIAGVQKESVIVWQRATGNRSYEVKGTHGRPAFSPDGKLLACGSDERIGLFEANSGKEIRRFERHAGHIAALTFSQDGRILASAADYLIGLWDVATGKPLHSFAGHESPVISLAFSPEGTGLASGESENGTLIIWDRSSQKPGRIFGDHSIGVRSVAYSPDCKILATGDGIMGSGGFDAQIRLWSIDEGRLLRRFPGHINGVHSLAFSPDGKTLASAGWDARAKLWDVVTGKRLHQIRGADSHHLKRVAFSPSGKELLVSGYSGELALWRVDSGQKARDLGSSEEERRAITFGAFLPDGRTVVSRESDRSARDFVELKFWDAEDGRQLRSFRMRGSVHDLATCALSTDGKTLATVGGDYRDSSIELWDMSTEEQVGRFRGHPGGPATALAFAPDSKLLASGGRDSTVLLWSVQRGRLEHLWFELGGSDGRESTQAFKKLATTPQEAIPFLREQLRQAAEADKRAGGHIVDLDDDRFQVREKASQDLEALGPDAEFPLRLALEGSPSVEARARIENILGKLGTSKRESPGRDPRSVRLSLAVLEEIGTLEAQKVLQELAQGPPKSTLTREARAALERLAKRQNSP